MHHSRENKQYSSDRDRDGQMRGRLPGRPSPCEVLVQEMPNEESDAHQPRGDTRHANILEWKREDSADETVDRAHEQRGREPGVSAKHHADAEGGASFTCDTDTNRRECHDRRASTRLARPSGPPCPNSFFVRRVEGEEVDNVGREDRGTAPGRPPAHERRGIEVVHKAEYMAKLMRNNVAHRVRQ